MAHIAMSARIFGGNCGMVQTVVFHSKSINLQPHSLPLEVHLQFVTIPNRDVFTPKDRSPSLLGVGSSYFCQAIVRPASRAGFNGSDSSCLGAEWAPIHNLSFLLKSTVSKNIYCPRAVDWALLFVWETVFENRYHQSMWHSSWKSWLISAVVRTTKPTVAIYVEIEAIYS